MAVTKADLADFHRFAEEQLDNGGSELSLDELVSQWHAGREREEVSDAIRESLDDIEAGRTQPFREATDEFRKNNNLPPRSV